MLSRVDRRVRSLILLSADGVMVEQRADGFKVNFTGSFSGNGPPQWQAKGLPSADEPPNKGVAQLIRHVAGQELLR